MHGVSPSLEGLRYVARAITPPGRTRRFDTRFFATWRESVAVELPDGGPHKELEELVWLPLAEAQSADIPSITRIDPRRPGTAARLRPAAASWRCRAVLPDGPQPLHPRSDLERSMVGLKHPDSNSSFDMTGNVPIQDDHAPVHWLAITAAIASISVVGIAIGLGMPLLSVILERQGYSASLIGLNTAVAGLASIAGAPMATPLAVRFGTVWTMVAMIILGAFAFVGFYFATAFWMWFPLRVLLHIALTVLFILSEFWISSSAPPHERGFVLGIYATVLSLGFALGPYLFARIGSSGFAPFGTVFVLVMIASGAGDRRLARKPDHPGQRRGRPPFPALCVAGADRDSGRAGVRRRRDRRLRAVPRLWRAQRLFRSRCGSAADHDRPRQRADADTDRHAERPRQRPPLPAARLRRRWA